MTGFEPGPLVSEATALSTVPQRLHRDVKYPICAEMHQIAAVLNVT